MSASVALILDTRAPVLTVEAPARVEPPDDLVVVLRASEPLGEAWVTLRDATGQVTNLGYERTDEHTLLVRLPTPGISTGTAAIEFDVADLVMNLARASAEVYIDRPRAFDVEFSIDAPYGVELALSRAYETVLTLGRGYDVDANLDGGYEVILDLEHAYETTLEVS